MNTLPEGIQKAIQEYPGMAEAFEKMEHEGYVKFTYMSRYPTQGCILITASNLIDEAEQLVVVFDGTIFHKLHSLNGVSLPVAPYNLAAVLGPFNGKSILILMVYSSGSIRIESEGDSYILTAKGNIFQAHH